MTTTTVETIIVLFNVKLKDQDFNHIFFHKQFSIDKNEDFDNMLSNVNFQNTIKIMHDIEW